ncbi:hypothetical protein A6A06_38895 [Streptomyces sp. CB02923]|nr:hypothetical protein A6A06_38895 [Streptomyces sp. CB02923]
MNAVCSSPSGASASTFQGVEVSRYETPSRLSMPSNRASPSSLDACCVAAAVDMVPDMDPADMPLITLPL